MDSEEFLKQYRTTPSAFSRERKLPFSSVILFLLSLIRASLQTELDRFFQKLQSTPFPLHKVTASAFCQARKKLRPEAFIALRKLANDEFYASGQAETWRGFRLVAVDTTTVRIPDAYDNRAFYGEACGPHGGCPSARISIAYDPLNSLILDEILAPYAEGDRSLAVQHLPVCRPGKDLLLLDRGYPAAWFFHLLLSRKLDFCCRTSQDQFSALDIFQDPNLKEVVITLTPSKACKEEYACHNLPFQTIQVRALRIRRLGRDDLILLTSLTGTERYPYEWFEELYCQRWPVEESNKLLICRLEIANFSGKSPQAILQDFHAKVFMLNLCSLLSLDAREEIAQSPSRDERPRQMNWTHALSMMRDCVVLLFTHDRWPAVFDQLHKLFSLSYHVSREGRRFERKKRFHRRMHHMAYKPIA